MSPPARHCVQSCRGSYLAAVEELQDDGRIFRSETRNMINYGIAVVLYDIAEWLDEHVSPDSLEDS